MARGAQLQEWFSAAELAELGLGLPSHQARRPERRRARGLGRGRCDPVRGALARPRKGRGGGLEFHVSLLPEAPQARLAAAAPAPAERLDRDSMWARWERLPEAYKAEARRRLEAIERSRPAAGRHRQGAPRSNEVARQALREARAAARAGLRLQHALGLAEADRRRRPRRPRRLPGAGLRRAAPRPPTAPDAWDFYKGDYLRSRSRRTRPATAACQRVAAENGWTAPLGQDPAAPARRRGPARGADLPALAAASAGPRLPAPGARPRRHPADADPQPRRPHLGRPRRVAERHDRPPHAWPCRTSPAARSWRSATT
jgi:putative transposase